MPDGRDERVERIPHDGPTGHTPPSRRTSRPGSRHASPDGCCAEHIRNVLSDESIDILERERRATILRDIAERIRQDGPHAARSHDDRARQFMPFAALKGYHGLVHERERVREPRHDVTEERARVLSDVLSRLSEGDMVSITHYENGAYTTASGTISGIDETFRTIRIMKRDIPFDDIVAIDRMEETES